VYVMRISPFVALAFAISGAVAGETPEALAEQLRRAETTFAKSMADRDHDAFTAHLAEDAVFFGRGATVLRGKAAIAAAWKPYFAGPQAPFSWTPEQAEVLESGRLGMTSGPVLDPTGARIGTFNSVWRREPDGTWKIVLDKGCPPCETAAPPAAEPHEPGG